MANNEETGKSPYLIKLVLLVAAVVVAMFLLWQMVDQDETPAGDPPTVLEEQPIVDPAPIPPVEPPVEQAPQPTEQQAAPAPPEPEPLPDLADSDAVALAAVDELAPEEQLSNLLVGDDVIMKSVRAVIALAGGNVVHEYRPVASPEGPFLVQKLDEPPDAEVGQRYRLSPENYQRYDRYVNIITSLDAENVAETYRRFYPLLEKAYASHGVDRGSFKQVTLNAIDGMLATPVLEQPPILIQPKVHYQFQDKRLESLPGPQKLLIRMGPENTRKVKSALQEIRQAIAATEVPSSPGQ